MPPTRATAAPTTIIVVFVVLERSDVVDVCDGIGVSGVVVLSETGVVVTSDGEAVVSAGAGAGV